MAGDLDEGRALPITTMSLAAYLRSRVFDRTHTEERLLSDLVGDLHSANYVLVDQLDSLLGRGAAAAERLDRDYHLEDRFQDGPFLEAVLDLIEPALCERKRRNGRNFAEHFDAIERAHRHMAR